MTTKLVNLAELILTVPVTPASLRSDLGFAAVASSASASDLTSGNLSVDRLPVIGNNTFLGNTSGSAGAAQALAPSQVVAVLPTFTSSTAGLVPSPDAAPSGKFLRDDGTWQVVSATGGISALTGDVTASGTGSVVATIASAAVTYAKIQNTSAASVLIGRGSSGVGAVQELSLGAGLAIVGTQLQLGTGSGSGTPTDAYDVMLLHMDDVGFTDALGQRTLGGSYQATLNTSTFKFGSGSVLFGTPYGQLTYTPGVVATGDFTIQGWVYPTTIPGSGDVFGFNLGSEGPGRRSFGYNSSHGGFYTNVYGDGSYPAFGGATMSTGAWQHVAIVRQGSTVSCYLNGALVGSMTISGSLGNTGGFSVSGTQSYMDEVLYSIGVARYTAPFTAPTQPWTNVTTAPFALLAGANNFTAASAASTPAELFSGAWYTAGNNTTNTPHVLVQPSAATAGNWNAAGTGLGVNAPSGFAGALFDLQQNGTSQFRVNYNGTVVFNGTLVNTGTGYVAWYGTSPGTTTPGSTAVQFGGGILSVGQVLDSRGTLQVYSSATIGSSLSVGTTLAVNGVTYTWPSANSAGMLNNNGSGTLTWTTVTPASIGAQAASSELTAVAGLATTGYVRRTGTATYATVTAIPQSDIQQLGYTLARKAQAVTGVMVPLYVYPSDPINDIHWNRFWDAARAYHDVPMVAIINPGSGPGSSIDTNYQRVIRRTVATGARIAGYVYTGYGLRDINLVKADIDTWKSLYPEVNALFVDEFGNGGTQTLIDFYAAVTAYARSKGFELVINNPGSDVPSGYLAVDAGDTYTIWETDSLPSVSYLYGNTANGHAEYDYRKYAVLVHSQSTYPTSWVTSVTPYVGWIYVTDDVMPNPWDTVTTYLPTLVAQLSAFAQGSGGGGGAYSAVTNATNTFTSSQVIQTSACVPTDETTYQLRIKTAGLQTAAFGCDTSNAYFQSFGSVPLLINDQGNAVHIVGSGASSARANSVSFSGGSLWAASSVNAPSINASGTVTATAYGTYAGTPPAGVGLPYYSAIYGSPGSPISGVLYVGDGTGWRFEVRKRSSAGVDGTIIQFLDSGAVTMTGTMTAGTFSGSGELLTDLPASQLTGDLPSISGANLTSVSAALLKVADTRNSSPAPSSYVSNAISAEFKSSSDVSLTTASGFVGLLTIKPWNDNSGGKATQLGFGDGAISFRQAGNGDGAWGSWSNIPKAMQIDEFLSGSGTYTVPVGCKRLRIRAVGGGGPGGGGALVNGASAGGGGGGSSAATLYFDLIGSQIPASVPYSVGAAGIGGLGATTIGSSGSDGTLGGDTTVTINDLLYTAYKGTAGKGGTASAGGAAGSNSTAVASSPTTSTSSTTVCGWGSTGTSGTAGTFSGSANGVTSVTGLSQYGGGGGGFAGVGTYGSGGRSGANVNSVNSNGTDGRNATRDTFFSADVYARGDGGVGGVGGISGSRGGDGGSASAVPGAGGGGGGGCSGSTGRGGNGGNGGPGAVCFIAEF